MSDDEEACGYTRLSYAPDGSLEKTDRQEADIRDLAGRLGWPIGHVYCDPSKSAWRPGVVRPDWESMLAAIKEGRWRRVITYHGDRLIRQPRDLERLLDLADARDLALASVSGVRDLSKPDDRFILRIEAAQACRESDNISRRTRRANRAKAEAGRVRRGRYGRAYGWTPADELVAAEVAEIEDWAGRLLAGEGMGSIAASLRARGVPTVGGGQWTLTTVREILANPRLAGLARYHDAVLGQGTWPAVLERDQWEAVQAVLAVQAARYPARTGPRDRVHLLSGIALCGSCTRGVTTTLGSYVCRQPVCPGPRVARRIVEVDELVIGRVLGRLAGEEVAPAAGADPVEPLRRELAGVQARMVEVEGQLAEPDGQPVAVLTRTAAVLEGKAKRLRAEITAVAHRPRHSAAGLDRDGWDALALSRRRPLVRDLYRVTILPLGKGHRFRPDSIRLDRL